MENLQISLPAPLKEFIDAEVSSGAYQSPSEFIRDLVSAAQHCKAEESLEAQLLEGLQGEGMEVTPEWWHAFHVRLKERYEKKGSP